ncbi:DUF2179 domain-containing protein [Candidatus Woesearchaeota archaeon]|jgi:uncharacterized protein YebE (UPF0316 family)|nr:DUF2179 domain-containing protein [Candidatus Woesearchaeota archaeon]MBT4321990.1 DUF2179 domain-containing protein [Candidatus Woesearchaeota archaeon]MBT4630736.1 DUF2179 domain-containing protein [Candidatus Woesearchaeota archaeon]
MEFIAFLDSNLYALVILPLFIFLARIIDVSMGTVRVIFISKGFKKYATIIGFFEVLIWLAAINQIMSNLTNYFYYFAYAGGFAMGTLVGMAIEEKISFGKVTLRVITRKDASELLEELRMNKYTVTSLGADGKDGKVKLILTIINRKDIKKITKIIKKHNPKAFYSIEDVRYVHDDSPIKKKNFFKLTNRK